MMQSLLAAFDPMAVAVVAFAGLVRGFSGFGFSLAAVPLLSGILPLNAVVPLVLALEALGVLPALGRVWRHAEWVTLGWLMLGSVIALPLGVLILHSSAPSVLRPAVSCAVLVAVALIWHPPALPIAAHRRPWAILAGGASGVLNGATAMSGPPIILYMLSGARSAAGARATMMLFFSCSAVLALAIGVASGTYAAPNPLRILWCLPFLALGLEIGIKAQHLTTPERSRRIALAGLALNALVSLSTTLL